MLLPLVWRNLEFDHCFKPRSLRDFFEERCGLQNIGMTAIQVSSTPFEGRILPGVRGRAVKRPLLQAICSTHSSTSRRLCAVVPSWAERDGSGLGPCVWSQARPLWDHPRHTDLPALESTAVKLSPLLV